MKNYKNKFSEQENKQVWSNDEETEMLFFDADDTSDFDVIEAQHISRGSCGCGCGGSGAGMGA